MKREADLVEVIVFTARLDLRPLVREDLDDIVRIFANGRAKRQERLTGDREEARLYLEKLIRFYDQQGFGQLAVVERKTRIFAGTCGFTLHTINGFREYILGYTLDEASTHAGFAREAIEAMCTYAFDQLDFMRIVMMIPKGLRKDIELVEAVGMEPEKEFTFARRKMQLYAIHNF